MKSYQELIMKIKNLKSQLKKLKIDSFSLTPFEHFQDQDKQKSKL